MSKAEYMGFSAHVWSTTPEVLTPAHAVEFNIEEVGPIMDSLRSLFDTTEGILCVDLKPAIDFRLLQESDIDADDAVTYRGGVNYSEFAWDDEGWVLTQLRVQKYGDIWLVFSSDDGEDSMEVKLRDSWDEWA